MREKIGKVTTPGGGSESLQDLPQKTGGPSRVKNRKIEAPGAPSEYFDAI